MKHLGATEAANAIRGIIATDTSARTDPAQAHRMKFVKDVCEKLGLDPSPENMQHVAVVLREQDIALHEGHEYPKHVVRKWDGAPFVANSAEEADAIINEEQPQPVPNAPVEDVAATDPGNSDPLFPDASGQVDNQSAGVDDSADVHVEEVQSEPAAPRKRPQ